MKFNIWTMNVYPLFNTHTTPHSIKFKFTGCTKNMCAINSFIFFQIIWFLLSVIFKEPNDNKKLRNSVTVQAFLFASFKFFLSQFKQSNVSKKHIHWLSTDYIHSRLIHCSWASWRLQAHACCTDFDGRCGLVGINLTILPLSVCLINIFSGRKNVQFHNCQIIFNDN